MKKANIIGMKFGRLAVLKEIEKNKNLRTFECICECGNKKIVFKKYLKNGETKSCGCLKKEYLKNKTIGLKHGMSRTKFYKMYDSIKKRCLNKNNKDYKNYGGRGIKICEEWLNKENGFINFYNWAIENGYKEGLSIDRINNNGNYEPKNCRWITNKEQQRNTRNNVFLNYKGETHCLVEWSEILGISKTCIKGRYFRNLPIEKILSTKDLRKEK